MQRTWDEAAIALFPVLRTTGSGLDLMEEFISRPVGEDLLVFTAHRTIVHGGVGFLFDYVTRDDVRNWDVDEEQVFSTAARNFSAQDLKGTRVDDETGDLVIIDRSGACATSVIAFPECREWFEDLGKELLVGLPSRDRLFVTGEQSQMALKLSEAVRHFFAQDDHALSEKVYLWTVAGIRVYER